MLERCAPFRGARGYLCAVPAVGVAMPQPDAAGRGAPATAVTVLEPHEGVLLSERTRTTGTATPIASMVPSRKPWPARLPAEAPAPAPAPWRAVERPASIRSVFGATTG